MKIAIIGTGNIGGALGRAWQGKGHEIAFGDRGTVTSAVAGADVVVFAVPFGAVANVIESAGSLEGKIVIDCTNPVGTPLPAGVASAAEHIAKLAPGARVVKSFNAQGAENIAEPRYGDVAASNFYCGDDAAAKKVVHGLVADVGFDPIDAGGLANARLLEAATLLWFSASRALGTRRTAFRMLR